MFKVRSSHNSAELLSSKLFNEKTFYDAFTRDLGRAAREVVIESPFITTNRSRVLLPIFAGLVRRGITVVINTRHPSEHDQVLAIQSAAAIRSLQEIGVKILFTGSHHRKLAIIDRQLLWEGSLNILSQSDSCEIMRRIDSGELATQLINFIGLNQFLGKS